MQKYWYDLTPQQWAEMTPSEWSEFMIFAEEAGLIIRPIDFPAKLKERIQTVFDILRGLHGTIEISASHQPRISSKKRAVVID